MMLTCNCDTIHTTPHPSDSSIMYTFGYFDYISRVSTHGLSQSTNHFQASFKLNSATILLIKIGEHDDYPRHGQC